MFMLSLACPSQDASRDGKCVSGLCECVCTHVLVCRTSAESSEAQSRRNTLSLTLSMCTCACTVCAYLSISVCMRERGNFLECARVLKVTRQHSGTRSLLYCLYVQKQTTTVEPCHWLVDTYSNMFSKSKKKHCQLREPDSISATKWKEQARHSKQAKNRYCCQKKIVTTNMSIYICTDTIGLPRNCTFTGSFYSCIMHNFGTILTRWEEITPKFSSDDSHQKHLHLQIKLCSAVNNFPNFIEVLFYMNIMIWWYQWRTFWYL